MGLHGLIRAPLNLSASCECRPTRPDGGEGVTGGERTGGDLGGPRETDWLMRNPATVLDEVVEEHRSRKEVGA